MMMEIAALAFALISIGATIYCIKLYLEI